MRLRIIKIVTITMLVGSGLEVTAQFIPNSTQSSQFASVYNPAFTGVDAYGDLKLGYRYQWAGFGDESPKFMNLTYNQRIKQPLNLMQNALRTSAPTYQAGIPKSKRLIHALGANFFDERVGVTQRTGGGINYSLHYPLSDKKNINVAGGVAAVFQSTRIDVSKIYLGINADPDPFYENLLNNRNNVSNLNLRAGLLVYSPKFYVGVSYLPIWTEEFNDAPEHTGEPFYLGTAQAGISFPVSPTIDLKVSALGILQADEEILFDSSLKVFYRQKIWLGGTYRSIQSAAGLVGFDINKLVSMAYSYEVSTNAFSQFNDGSHELVLSLKVNNFRNVNSYAW